MKRAVITGLGIVSSIGNNQQEVLASLREGRSGITFSQELKDSGMRSHVWGNVKLDTTGLIDRKVVRFHERRLHLCLPVHGTGRCRRRSGAGSIPE
jgi:3-oxoacyl-[acyl-carrier-protein] synthase-1